MKYCKSRNDSIQIKVLNDQRVGKNLSREPKENMNLLFYDFTSPKVVGESRDGTILNIKPLQRTTADVPRQDRPTRLGKSDLL